MMSKLNLAGNIFWATVPFPSEKAQSRCGVGAFLVAAGEIVVPPAENGVANCEDKVGTPAVSAVASADT